MVTLYRAVGNLAARSVAHSPSHSAGKMPAALWSDAKMEFGLARIALHPFADADITPGGEQMSRSPFSPARCIPKLLVTERGVYAASTYEHHCG